MMLKPNFSVVWFLLNVTKLVRKRKEWVRNGGSFIHYQASYWKVVQPGAHFDPDKTSENENQGRTPPELGFAETQYRSGTSH
jgi:hypothetical protein